MSSESTGASELAERYATALFELAERDKVLDDIAQDLAKISEMLGGSEDLGRLVRSPVISGKDQVKAMAAVLDKAGVQDITKNFVGVVAANRRLFALPGMIVAFNAILAGRRGEATAEVVSAAKLTKKQIDSIGASLKKAIGTAVTVDAKVDPDILGGLIVKVGSRMVDSSLRTKLQHLRLAMKGVG